MADTQQIIMVSVVVTAGSTLIAEQQTTGMTFKPIVGGWILGMILFVTATFADDLARAFAILVMVSALLINGAHVFSVIGKATGAKTATGTSTSTGAKVPSNVTSLISGIPL